MARCGCGGNTCTCQILAGSNIQITGTGSQANPFVITGSPASLEAGDNVTISGLGTVGDPFVITALTDCAEVRTCISAGPGITYNSGTGVISSDGSAIVNTSCGLDGDGSAGSPLNITAGAWPYPCDVTTAGTPVYCDANGQLRTTPPHTATQAVQQTQTAYPNVLVPVPDDTQIEIQMLAVVNPDPCRPAFVIIEQEVEASVDMPVGSSANWGIGTDDMVYRFNNGTTPQVNVTSQHTKVIATIIGAGVATVTQMRVTMGRGSGGATYDRIQTFLQAFILTIAD